MLPVHYLGANSALGVVTVNSPIQERCCGKTVAIPERPQAIHGEVTESSLDHRKEHTWLNRDVRVFFVRCFQTKLSVPRSSDR